MNEDFFIVSNGELKRKNNSVQFISSENIINIPINSINSLHILGSVRLNSQVFLLFTKHQIPIHFYSFYGRYAGAYYPKKSKEHGRIIVEQVKNYLDDSSRCFLAKKFMEAGVYNIVKNLKKYKKTKNYINKIEHEFKKIEKCRNVNELLGVEGRIRQIYYSSWNTFLRRPFNLFCRTKNPPKDEINCLISFGNALLYSTILTEIYKTSLNPSISYLHEPSIGRFSLCFDISEIFKPIIVDRVIFNLINNRIINSSYFDKEQSSCYLNEKGKKNFFKIF